MREKNRQKRSLNKSTKTEEKQPRKKGVEFWTLDAETDPFNYGAEIKPFIWGVYTGEKFHSFRDTEKLIEFIKDKHVKLYAHNGGKFDFHFLLKFINPISELLVIDGRIVKMEIGECQLFDSYTLIPQPLSSYKKDEFEYEKMKAGIRETHIEEITEYLKNDCIYLYELLDKFFTEYGKNITIASSALKYWLKMEQELRPACGSKLFNDIQPYYFGGRVECFFKGIIEGEFTVIDINSAYPRAMMENHPYGSEYFSINFLPEKKEEIQRSFITLKCFSKGAFPVRDKTGLNFPHGEAVFNVTGWEYLSAKKLNLISDEKILKVIIFPEKKNYKNYINHFFQKKLEAELSGDKGNRMLAKLFLNSLYGRYAINPENHKKTFCVPTRFAPQLMEENFKFITELENGLCLIECPIDEETAEKKYLNCSISASITGYVRAFLLESIHSCEGALYCDTDSIACRSTGKLNLSDKLGDWKNEGVFVRGAIAGKKLYAFIDSEGKEKIASKGVKLSAKEIFKLAAGHSITYQKESPTFSLKKRRDTERIKTVGNAYYIEREIKVKI